jgi:ABC-2 type transport system ATP-binding protein
MAGPTPDVLVAESLVRSFGDRKVVDAVSLRIAPGETYGLLGPNGAGKTTTISMVCGLLSPDGGEVRVLGSKMRPGRCDAKRHIGLVPQDLALYPDLSARENLEFFGRLQGLESSEVRHRIDEVLDIVGLSDRGAERIDAYSGGMKRRCNIAAALLHRPELLVLDEPTVGVDPQSRNSILSGIAELQREGLAVLYTTHYMEEAERLCDRIGIMDEGVMIAEGTTDELVELVAAHPIVRLRGDRELERLAARLADVAEVERVAKAEGRIDVVAARPDAVLRSVLAVADEEGVTLSGLEVESPDLEDVFLHLTGKALRD